jgi:large subunit ribosomal protein L24
MVTKKPRKQRNRRKTAVWHRRHKLITARLSPELAEKHGIKKIPVRKGDTAYVIRGQFRDSEGEVQAVDYKTLRLHIENITMEKVDGSAVPFPIHPSCVMLTKLNIDSRRQAIIDRKVAARGVTD